MKNMHVDISTTRHIVDIKVTGDVLIHGLPGVQYETKTERFVIKRNMITAVMHYADSIAIEVDERRGAHLRQEFSKQDIAVFKYNGHQYAGHWKDLVCDMSDLVNE